MQSSIASSSNQVAAGQADALAVNQRNQPREWRQRRAGMPGPVVNHAHVLAGKATPGAANAASALEFKRGMVVGKR